MTKVSFCGISGSGMSALGRIRAVSFSLGIFIVGLAAFVQGLGGDQRGFGGGKAQPPPRVVERLQCRRCHPDHP